MYTLADYRREIRPTLRLAVPLIIAELGWKSMDLVDTMMVGRISAEAIGAVSIGAALSFAVGIFGAGLLLGLDTLVSQAFGAGRVDDCHRSLVNSLYMALVIAPVLMGLLWASVPYLHHLNIHPAVLGPAIPYLNAVTWSILPLQFYFAFRRYLQGMSLVKPVTFALITANGVNVFANWAMIFGHLGFPAMGPEGAGWATLLSRIYLAVVLLVYIVWHDRRYGTHLWKTSFQPDLERIRRLLALGFPVAMQILLEVGVFASATALISTLDPVSLAAHQIAINAASFTFMMPLGIGSAAAVRVGQALGRRDPGGAARSGWTALALATLIMCGTALVFFLVPGYVVRIFTSERVVLETGITLLFIAAVFQICDGVQVVATGALRGAGDTRTPMLISLVSFWVVGLPVGYYLGFPRGWGAPGVWTGLCAGLVLIGIILLWVWHRQVAVWKRSNVFAVGVAAES